MTQLTDWKAAYASSGQYEADLQKAQSLGHTIQAFGVTFAKAQSQEEFNEKLARFQQRDSN